MNVKCKQQIAILLATYNGASYLCEQIDSILNQSFADWHLYIHDDGSTDNTQTIVHDYTNRFPEKITVLEYPPQGGACNNFFSLLDSVEAPYYMFSDQDDVWKEYKIQRCYETMQQQEKKHLHKPILIHSDMAVVDSQLNTIAPSFVRNQRIKVDKVQKFVDFAFTNTVTGCTMFFNMATAECIKHPRDYARMHDSWITLSVVSNEGVLHFIDEPLLLYRQHGDNTLGAKELENINILTKLRNIRSVMQEIVGHYREMNAIRRISFISYLRARLRYKFL